VAREPVMKNSAVVYANVVPSAAMFDVATVSYAVDAVSVFAA
jgi:hypothetical protein